MEEINLGLREIRKMRGFTQNSLAKKLGVNRGTVFAWEHNPDIMPLGKFKKLCGLLGLDITLKLTERRSDNGHHH